MIDRDDDLLWVEKYRPRKIVECILPERIKSIFQSIVDSKELPNLLLHGSSGTGKTTVARALCNELGVDYIIINGSQDGNIDTLRTRIKSFASTVSLAGNRKAVILDESDFLNPTSTQPALRGFIEEFSANCRFIFTCNYPAKILPAIHSRCSVISFSTNKKEQTELAKQLFTRISNILKSEKVEFEKTDVAVGIQRHLPDFRRIINEFQSKSHSGQLKSVDTGSTIDYGLAELIPLLSAKDFTKLRKWAATYASQDSASTYSQIYRHLETHGEVPAGKLAQAILITDDFDRQHSFCADPEIHLSAFLLTIAMEVF